MNALLVIAKHWRSVGVAALLVVFVTAFEVQAVRHAAALKIAIDTAKTSTRDSVAKASQVIVDSTSREILRKEGELETVKRAADHTQHVAEVRARAHEATDRLYASLQHLSEPAKADTTVTVLASASVAIKGENDSLKVSITDVVTAAQQERIAADALHAADTAALHGLAGTAVAVRDSLAVEVKKPKRTWKSDWANRLAGGAFTEVLNAVVKTLVKGKR